MPQIMKQFFHLYKNQQRRSWKGLLKNKDFKDTKTIAGNDGPWKGIILKSA